MDESDRDVGLETTKASLSHASYVPLTLEIKVGVTP